MLIYNSLNFIRKVTLRPIVNIACLKMCNKFNYLAYLWKVQLKYFKCLNKVLVMKLKSLGVSKVPR